LVLKVAINWLASFGGIIQLPKIIGFVAGEAGVLFITRVAVIKAAKAKPNIALTIRARAARLFAKFLIIQEESCHTFTTV